MLNRPHLHQFVQFRQFVHGKNAAVHPRDQAEVQGLLRRHALAARQFRRVDLADDVRELRARREPLRIAFRPRPPADRDFFLGVVGDKSFADPTDRAIRVVVKRGFRDVDVGDLRIQKPNQRPHQPALGLPFFAQKQQIVPGNQCQVDFGNDRVFIADDSGKQLLAPGQHAQEIVPDFLLDRFGDPTAFAELAEIARFAGCRCHGPDTRQNAKSLEQTRLSQL